MNKERKFTILIVDDEPDILELMEEEFNYHGYATVLASCGLEAIDKIRTYQFDLVISDYKMPNGNGMSVLEEINLVNKAQRPDFIFVSGQADISVKDAIDAGARGFFSKPFDLDDLVKEVDEIFLKKNEN